MRTLTASSAILACVAALLANDCRANGDAAVSSGGVCAGKVESMANCRWIRGTLEVYNGTPPIRIRQHGSRRIYAVGPAEQEWMPQDLRSRLTPDNRVSGLLRICPIHEHPARGLPEMCIDQARMPEAAAASATSR